MKRVLSANDNLDFKRMNNNKPQALVLLNLLVLSLSGCVTLPKTTEIYNPDCQFVTKHSELESVYIAALGGCKDEQCAGLLVFASAVTAASIVLSGSVVLMENMVYWLEKPDDCNKKTH